MHLIEIQKKNCFIYFTGIYLFFSAYSINAFEMSTSRRKMRILEEFYWTNHSRVPQLLMFTVAGIACCHCQEQNKIISEDWEHMYKETFCNDDNCYLWYVVPRMSMQ